MLHGLSLSPVSMFPISSQSRPQEVGGAAAYGPGVAGLEVRGRVEGDGNGEGVEARKYSGIWAQTGRGGHCSLSLSDKKTAKACRSMNLTRRQLEKLESGVCVTTTSTTDSLSPAFSGPRDSPFRLLRRRPTQPCLPLSLPRPCLRSSLHPPLQTWLLSRRG
uniref:Uncharacterized protein n=1 Tax=Chromera velia CCMP2878 TaxID=1169474 RepID=A0A0G4HMQ5_9ALVE|eukprot:Cvel_29368.t1-p1 / transcript=Cvel_29368.t1 / gene=Cvel_29368 / organism=Chromera_velia_CCMP2878 / gene_product=hypothetical protein / transcript_product=hypothetical protein / location=Cvel_scaffold4002:7367-7849(+) / protein_length=161 / sequence_SO=supercontig / SO=protein_coding / is_pseudo=false